MGTAASDLPPTWGCAMVTGFDYDVLVVGDVGVTTLVRLDGLALPADDLDVPPIRDHVDHSGDGVALGAHHLGLRTKLLGYLGDDEQGAFVLRDYLDRGLAFSWLRSPQGTARSVTLVDDEGRRLSYHDGRRPGGPPMEASFVQPCVRRSRHVHLGATDRNRDLLPVLTADGCTVSVGVDVREGVQPWHAVFARQADLVFLEGGAANAGERRTLEPVMRWFVDQGGASTVVAPDRRHGCHLLERENRALRGFPAVEPLPGRSLADGGAAGGAFTAGFLSAWLKPREGRRDAGSCVPAGQVAGAYAAADGTFIDPLTLAVALLPAQTASPGPRPLVG